MDVCTHSSRSLIYQYDNKKQDSDERINVEICVGKQYKITIVDYVIGDNLIGDNVTADDVIGDNQIGDDVTADNEIGDNLLCDRRQSDRRRCDS